MKWWDDLWLNEGFATFMEYLAVKEIHSDWGMEDQFTADVLSRALSLDILSSSHPIQDKEVVTTDHIKSMFDAISYSKVKF